MRRSTNNIVQGARRLALAGGVRNIVGLVALTIASSIALALQLLALNFVSKELLASPPEFSSAAFAGLLFVAVLSLRPIVSALLEAVQRLYVERTASEIRREVLEKVNRQSSMQLESPDFHNAVAVVMEGSAGSLPGAVPTLLNFGVSAITMIVLGAVLIGNVPTLAVVIILCLPFLGLIVHRLGGVNHALMVNGADLFRRRSYFSHVLAHRDYARELRAFDWSGLLLQKFNTAQSGYLELVGETERRRIKLQIYAQGISFLVFASGLILILMSYLPHSPAGAVTMTAILWAFGGYTTTIVRTAASLGESRRFLDSYHALITMPDGEKYQSANERTNEPNNDGNNEANCEGRSSLLAGNNLTTKPFLQTSSLSFKYPGATKNTLTDINLELNRGETLVITGPNGTGKTTFAHILAGLLPPSEGDLSVCVGREETGLLFQDPIQLHTTLAENVTCSKTLTNSEQEKLDDVLTRVGLEHLGHKIEIGPEWSSGTDLSGGQWKKVAIARLLFRDPELIILDEPGAWLDSSGIRLIHGLVDQFKAQGKTTVIVTHDPAIASKATQRLEFEKLKNSTKTGCQEQNDVDTARSY